MAYEFTRKKVIIERRALAIQIAVAAIAAGLVLWGIGTRFEPDTAIGALQTAIYPTLAAFAAFFGSKLLLAVLADAGNYKR